MFSDLARGGEEKNPVSLLKQVSIPKYVRICKLTDKIFKLIGNMCLSRAASGINGILYCIKPVIWHMKNDDEKSIELKLIDDVSISEIAKISTDISEITLDSIMEDGILKDFPFISTVVSIIKTTQNVRERIYAKKILLFLNSSNKGDSEKRIAFIQKLNKNPSEKQKVGETLMLILEKND